MPKFRVDYTDNDGMERYSTVVAKDKHEAADRVLDEQDADSIDEVEEIG